jgi:hypothetical protein
MLTLAREFHIYFEAEMCHYKTRDVQTACLINIQRNGNNQKLPFVMLSQVKDSIWTFSVRNLGTTWQSRYYMNFNYPILRLRKNENILG